MNNINIDDIFFLIDAYSVAHTTVKCEEYHAPAQTRLYGNAVREMHLPICADCEPN
jgi:hypothetical protein